MLVRDIHATDSLSLFGKINAINSIKPILFAALIIADRYLQ